MCSVENADWVTEPDQEGGSSEGCTVVKTRRAVSDDDATQDASL
jgi:hypothetical protein